MYLFLYAPIISLAVFSFNDAKSMAKWSGFSLRWYQELFQNERILDALYYTILIALLAAAISTIVGTITAIGIHKMRQGKVRITFKYKLFTSIKSRYSNWGGINVTICIYKIRIWFYYNVIITYSIWYTLCILSVLPKLKQLPANIEMQQWT